MLPDDSFSTFVDHLVLILAARFHASLDEADQSAANHSAWDLVAECVRAQLMIPRTPEEVLQLKHVDVPLFTADVCKERARFFMWQQRRRQAAKKTSTRTTNNNNNNSSAPSGFDITLGDSIHREVDEVYAAVRRHLPSTMQPDDDDDDDDDDASVPVVMAIPTRTETEVKKDHEFAIARDAMLSKIQAMQAELYAQHRRWVDVPVNVLDDLPAPEPAPRRPAPAPAPAHQAHPPASRLAATADEEAERAELLRMLGGEAGGRRPPREHVEPSPLQALRQSVRVERPARPSEAREDAIRPSNPAPSHKSASPMNAMRRDDGPAAGGRGGRWQVVEYDEDSDDSGSDDE